MIIPDSASKQMVNGQWLFSILTSKFLNYQ